MSLRVENFRDYLSLHDENRKLAEENAQLYNSLVSSYLIVRADSSHPGDSTMPRRYYFLTSKAINNTVNKQFNFITIDKGSRGGIQPEMAVISSEGIVGVVKSVSENYSSVLSVLNRDFTVSAKIKKNGYFGPLNWNGKNSNYATLVDIPHHVIFERGDTVVTSGFGGVFPEGFLIGIIDDYKLKGGNYFEIRVKLSNDFRKLNYLQIIKNYGKQEIDSLENAVAQ
jgi:rod shape-determining protein MreC